MPFAVLERSYLPALAAPISYDHWMQVNHSLDGCLGARDLHWLYSLVSAQGNRSLCLFEVPYTETVREACREARISFQQVWQAELWLDQEPASLPQGTSLVIVEVNNSPPLTQETWRESKQQVKGCLHELNIQYVFSAVMMDGTYSICMFLATSAEDVRSLYRKFAKPFVRIWKATLIQNACNNL